MGIHYFDLQAASLIQEKHSVSLSECEQALGKSISSIKRSIAAVNEYLSPEKQILTEDNCAVFQMGYQDYIQFIQTLSLEDYYPCQSERLDIMTVYGFFNQNLNLTRLYDSLHISISTKKKDSRGLSDFLKKHGLSTVVIPKTGISITGDEIQFRLCVCDILYHYIEVDRDFNLTRRQANNPWQAMIAEYWIVKSDLQIQKAKKMISEYVAAHHCRISYTSVKFLYLYISCAYYRVSAGFPILNLDPIPLETFPCRLMENSLEDMFLDRLISSLDYTSHVVPPAIKELTTLTQDLVRRVQEQIVTWISDDHYIYEEVYAYLHKCVIRNIYQFSFYDNKLEETKQQYNNLYDVVQSAVGPFEEFYGITMSHFQVSSLTLIFRKFINRNKLAGRNKKRLVIVTNSSIEKIEFFMEKLKLRIDAELVDIININELYLLEQMEYDHLIVFSNRISAMLDKLGYPCLKLHFYLIQEDFDLLFQNGFSTSRRKLKACMFAKDIEGMTQSQLTQYLLSQYSDFFLE